MFRWECAPIVPRVRASPGFALNVYIGIALFIKEAE